MYSKIIFICVFLTLWLYNGVLHAEMRDPTKPSTLTEEAASPWQLSAIFISEERRVAIINGQTVTLGEDVEGEKVIAIESDSVILEGPEGKMTLYLFDQSIKQRVNGQGKGK